MNVNNNVVTIYTKKGTAITTEGVYCKHCVEESSSSDGDDRHPLTIPPAQTTKQPKESETSDVHPTNPQQQQQQGQGSNSTVTSPSFLTNNTLTEPLIQENDKRPTDRLDVRNKEKTSPTSIIGALTWLNWKLMYKNWKMFILPLLVLIGWCLYIFLIGKLTFPVIRCPDGR